jgi:RNA polymerase sigma-70 factor (ECF subfamily)
LTGEPPTDPGLASRILAGDRAAFEELVSRYHRVVFSIAYRMTGSRFEAEDVSQDVFLRVYRAMDRYDPSLPFGPWIRRIAANATWNRLRSRGVARRLEGAADTADETAERVADPSPGPQERLEESERSRRLTRALSALPENQRLAFTLKYVEGLTVEEVAAAMDAPRNSVKTWLLRARERLREELVDEL